MIRVWKTACDICVQVNDDPPVMARNGSEAARAVRHYIYGSKCVNHDRARCPLCRAAGAAKAVRR